MKTYSTDSKALYESTGFGTFEPGKTYTTPKGHKVTVENLSIDASGTDPKVMVKYSFTDDSKTINEENTVDVFLNKLRKDW